MSKKIQSFKLMIINSSNIHFFPLKMCYCIIAFKLTSYCYMFSWDFKMLNTLNDHTKTVCHLLTLFLMTVQSNSLPYNTGKCRISKP